MSTSGDRCTSREGSAAAPPPLSSLTPPLGEALICQLAPPSFAWRRPPPNRLRGLRPLAGVIPAGHPPRAARPSPSATPVSGLQGSRTDAHPRRPSSRRGYSADPAAPLTRNAPGARISRSFVMQAADLSTCQQSLPTASYLPTDRWARSVVMKVISHPESHTVATLS